MPKNTQLEQLKYQGRNWDKDFYKTNVYSESLINEYLDDLKIETKEGRERMENSILYAAMYYEAVKKSHIQSYAPAGEIERELRALAKPLEKLIQKLENMNVLGKTGVIRSYREILSESEPSRGELQFANALFWGNLNGGTINPDGLINFLKNYQKATSRALEKEIGFVNAAHKSYPLETWLLNLNNCWKQYSPIPFNAGKYYKEVGGYNSEALHILKKIMEPLDNSITIQAIATKLIEANSQKE